MFERAILIVLDSLGVGAAKDAHRFGDEGSHTLGNIIHYCQNNNIPFHLPHLSSLGLGKIYNSKSTPLAATSAQTITAILEEISPGKDTSTGHWEIAGTPLTSEFPTYPKGFPEELLQKWCQQNNLPGWLGNYAASGTDIIVKLGEEHLRTGKPIVYTSADSVFQVAASEESFGLQKLYQICQDARKLLDPLNIGRIIARPFVGKTAPEFKRTENRRDYSLPPPSPNLLDVLRENNAFVAGVGKIEDIYAHRSLNIVDHTGRNETSLIATLKHINELKGKKGLIFTNLIDFDQLHGHRRNPKSYAEALMEFDEFLPKIIAAMDQSDVLILTADHGNDPTFRGTDHTRENVPLIVYSKNKKMPAKHLGQVKGFHVIAKFVLEALGYQAEIKKIKTLSTAISLGLEESTP